MAEPQYPMKRKMSKKTTVRLCFKDGHIEVLVAMPPKLAKLPFVPEHIPLRIDAEDIPQAFEVLQVADGWCKLPAEERERLAAE